MARERLFLSMDAKREHPVVWVTGPPGSGKTTLVASYLEATAAPAVWYLLDNGDSDPATFFYYLAQAVSDACRTPGKPLPLLTQEYLADLEGFSRRFVRDALARLPEGGLIVLDNYHEIAPDSPLHRMLSAAVAEVPEGANIIVISRLQPPGLYSRSRVAGVLEILDWDELRLEPEETAAIVARRRALEPEVAAAIHAQSGGWVAGVRLLLERADPATSIVALARPEALEFAFDYFAAEIFTSAPEPLRHFLLHTAFLPRFTVAMAATVSGDAQAGRLIEELYRRRLFVDRRTGREVTYQYHDLFRAFLTGRAVESLPSREVAALIGQSARLLLAANLADEAFSLFVRAEDWEAAEHIFLEQANALIARGRWRTLEEWAEALPIRRLEANAWLRYWLGRSRALVNAAEAFPMLEGAYESFREKQDNHGQLLCAAAVVETLHFVIEHWETMGAWHERLRKDLELQDAPLSPDDELRIHAALFWAAENSFNPVNPVVAPSVARVLELLPLCTDINLRISVANILHYHSERSLDHRVSDVAAREARRVLGSADLSADRHALYYLAEGFAHFAFARYRQAFECYDRADTIIEANGLVGRDYVAAVWRALCQCAAGDLEAAQATSRRLETLNAVDLHVITHVLENARSWIAFGRGEIARALEHNQASIHISETLGPCTTLSLLLPNRAFFLIAASECGSAREPLDRIWREKALIEFEHMSGSVALLEAWLASRLGDQARCLEILREALALGRDECDRLRMRWYRMALQDLLPIALQHGVEIDVAHKLIRECAIPPPSWAPDYWPWPVRIYTLGRFEVVVNDKQLEFGRKAPKRTIALLKALIALGGRDVPEQRLADALWPDLEADAALESLAAALHRLRRLLGANEAIRQRSGTLSLNEQHCFVDAPGFEEALNRQGSRAALPLYRGNFLPGDTDAPWSASTRERLRGKFIRAVESAGRDLEGAGRPEEAVDLYLRGIETDDLVEPFYRGLMRCYCKLNRHTEAAATFRRLRQTLSVTLGAKPSSESQKLVEELRLK